MTNKTSSDKTEIVARLKSQRAANQAEWKRCGRTDGNRWAQRASYNALIEWARIAESGQRCEVPGDVEDMVNDYMKDFGEFDKVAYAEGWLEGVFDFWLSVEDEVEEE